MANIKLVTHSSVLIQEQDSFILTDPWFEKPAFGSWLPVPPATIHPAYLVALARTNPNFSILISHGHDDHLDDDFLALFPEDTSIIVPEYPARGVFKRVSRLGFKNIIEVPMSGIKHGCFEIKSYMNMAISRDDAILSIKTDNNLIIHANDNWQEVVGENLNALLEDAAKFEGDKILYMSQCNLADGFPNIYRNYTEDEKTEIHNSRVDNIISMSLLNAHKLGAKYFLNYAGYAAAFVKDKDVLRQRTSFRPNQQIQKVCDDLRYDVLVLDMLPGDFFDFEKITEQFPGIKLDISDLKQESFSFYEKYRRIEQCDSHKNHDYIDKKKMLLDLKNFLEGFEQFVEPRVKKTDFNPDIMGYRIGFKSPDLGVQYSKVIGGDNAYNGNEVQFYVEGNILAAIMSGQNNWENLYIGYHCEVETKPKDINIRAVVRWMAMYGYFYQRGKNDW